MRQFAEWPDQWENASMQKLLKITGIIVVAGFILVGSDGAQQTPASSPPKTPPAKAQAPAPAKTPEPAPAKAPAAKTGQGTPPGKASAGKTVTLTTPKDKASYAIGMNIGNGLHRDSVDVDPNILLEGLKVTLAGGKGLLTDDEAKAALTELQAEVTKRQQEKMQVVGESNKKEGDAFLAANKTKDGVVTLPSGLQYKILQEGTGPKPSASDTVVCNYRGTLLNGTEFDSSYKRGQPATFAVGQVIHGWTEALQLMPVGSKWQLFIPAELAYGARPAGPDIGPNSTLIFEVELLSIQEKK
jgi:FKBP-type peptidyl-prolyl cis-trans isomerase